MTRVAERLKTWFGAKPPRSPDDAPPRQEAASIGPEPDLARLAQGLGDGAPCPAELCAALETLMAMRRLAAGVQDGPSSPKVSGLHVRRSGLPEGWNEDDNLLLVGEGATPSEVKPAGFRPPPRRSVVVQGAHSRFGHINIGMDGALVVLGDRVSGPIAAMTCLDGASVLLGEGLTCTNWAMLDCRNQGAIVVGAEGMWAHGVSLMTDDTHAIRDVATGKRLNTYGGRIVVGRHVWLCEHSRLLDGARVGADSVIGAGSLVKRGVVPDNTVAVGVPARPVRSGIVWSREDMP